MRRTHQHGVSRFPHPVRLSCRYRRSGRLLISGYPANQRVGTALRASVTSTESSTPSFPLASVAPTHATKRDLPAAAGHIHLERLRYTRAGSSRHRFDDSAPDSVRTPMRLRAMANASGRKRRYFRSGTPVPGSSAIPGRAQSWEPRRTERACVAEPDLWRPCDAV
jgi:hypothetical protein